MSALLLLKKPGVALEFKKSNPRAQSYAAKHAAELVVDISKKTERAIRLVVERAFTEHVPPAQAARLIKPLIGLTEDHAQAVLNFRDEILANPGRTVVAGSGSTRIEIDVHQDGASDADILKATEAYADALLDLRAETIARTETLAASNEGQHELWDQAVEEDLLPRDVRRVWIATPDERECPICESLDGQAVGLGESFVDDDGEQYDDPPAHPNCRCAQGIAEE